MCIEITKGNYLAVTLKLQYRLPQRKRMVFQVFAIEGQNTYIQCKNTILMRIGLTDENGEEIPGVGGLVEAIEDLELKTGLLLAACMISMIDIG